MKGFEETGCGDGELTWEQCQLCTQYFHGTVKLALGWAMWKTYLGRPEAYQTRSTALTLLAGALLKNNNAKAAHHVLEYHLATFQRIQVPPTVVLACQTNMAVCLDQLGQNDDALHRYREIYASRLELLGAFDETTILDGTNVAYALMRNELWREAQQFARRQYRVARRALNERNKDRIRPVALLADALYHAPTATRADVVEAEFYVEALKMRRIALGPEHPHTVRTEKNLANARAFLARLHP